MYCTTWCRPTAEWYNERRLTRKHIADAKVNESGVGKIRNFQPISRSISETVQDIGPKLLLMTNRKSHTPFDRCQNQRSLMTLNCRYALCCGKDASFGAHQKKCEWSQTHTISNKKCRPLTLVSGGIRLIEYLQRFPGKGASNDNGAVENGNF